MAEGGSADLDRLLTAVHTLAPLIRAHADENEQQRRLSPSVVATLAEAGLFRMYTSLWSWSPVGGAHQTILAERWHNNMVEAPAAQIMLNPPRESSH